MFAVTFYSFKGGVGRTLAAANVAACLAEQGLEVLLADFDLEAPGLTHLAELAPPGGGGHAGVVEYLADAWERKTSPDLEPYLYQPEGFEGHLAVMPAGNVAGGSFGEGVRALREADFWRVAFDRQKGAAGLDLFLDLKRGWEHLGFDYVMIDSRTGLTDVGGVCTRLLPDAVVVLFGLGHQGLDGVRRVVEQVRGGTVWGTEIPVMLVETMLPEGEDELRERREAMLPAALQSEGLLRLPLHPRLLLQEEVRHYQKEDYESSLAPGLRELARRLRRLNTGDFAFRLEDALGDGVSPKVEELSALVGEMMDRGPGSFRGRTQSRRWAEVLNRAAVALRQAPAASPEARGRQISLATAALRTLVALAVHTEERAARLNSLANALMELPAAAEDERRRNVQEAVAAYKAALEIYPRDRHPVEWAMTQNNLANALVALPATTEEERQRNQTDAVEGYRAALEVRRRERHPAEWAMTTANLANALIGLQVDSEKRQLNLRKAVELYRGALDVYQPDSHPGEWARTVNGLANALTDLAAADAEERRRNLLEAVEHYRAALEVRLRDRYPSEWAALQHNLGAAFHKLSALGGEERGRNLGEAVGHYREALEVRRRDRYPHHYAETCNNLASALHDLGDREGAAHYLDEAWALRGLLPDRGERLADLLAALAPAKGARKAPRPRPPRH